jgi:pentatricopeptide repeat protein
MRFLTLVDRCRRHNRCLVISSIRCSWLVTDDGNHVRYLTTLMNSTMIGQHRSYYSASLSQELLQPRRLQFLCRSLSTNTHDDNETTNEEIKHWNSRVEEFLDRTSSTLSLLADEQKPSILQLSPDEAAATIQTLLDDLLQITAVTKKGERREDEVPSSSSSSYSSPLSLLEDIDNFESQTNYEIYIDKPIEVGLAFALIDRLVALEQSNDHHHTLQWTAHSSCLNPILHIWKHKYSPSMNSTSKVQSNPATSMKTSRSATYDISLTPSQVLAKLDTYREHSNLLIPNVQSYNTILDAVATHNNDNRNIKTRTRSTKGQNRSNDNDNNNNNNVTAGKSNKVVDIDFCQSLWAWMWQESKQDSLVRPDEVTLRTMLKANVLTGHELAPQRCEALVEEWAEYHSHNKSNILHNNDNDNDNDNDQEERQTINDPNGTLLLSLIHVWALHDPYVAESYLKELTRRYLSGHSHNPPDTIAWNRVVSAYAIAHNQPEKGHQVLEDFWEFYQQVHAPDNNDGDISTYYGNATINDVFSSPSKYDTIWKVSPPNLQSYNALLEGYARQENANEANMVFSRLQMVDSTSPNIATYTSAIKANGRDLKKVQEIAQQCISVYNAQVRTNDEGNEDKKSSKHLSLDRGFFHAWLNACAKAENIVEAKNILKQMKTLNLKPNATTYRMLIGVFLSTQDSQKAIEWLLAYAKLEGMSESAIVSCTIHLLDWYRNQYSHHSIERPSEDVDSMILLQVLCENNFLTEEGSLQQLLLGVSANQGRAVLGWLRGKDITSLKMWAIVMRAFAQEGSQAQAVEELFLQLQDEQSWKHKFNQNKSSAFDDEEQKLLAEMYGSMIVAWSKQGNAGRIKYWVEKLDIYPDGSLPLNLAAQIAIVTMYCNARDPIKAEKYVNELEAAFEKGEIVAPPDTIMCNMILNAWSQRNNGDRAASFFEQNIKEPDVVSYNTVINAFARQGNLTKSEQWAYELVASFCENSVESRRPQQATFTVILAGWRRSKDRNAAERATKVLMQMHQLYDNSILLHKPDFKSYQTVLDAWEKSSDRDAAQKAEEFLSSSSDFRDNKRLRSKVRNMISRERKRNRVVNEGSKTNSANKIMR